LGDDALDDDEGFIDDLECESTTSLENEQSIF
jgi:hypothetical protein